MQQGLEDGAGTYRAEECLGEGPDRYLCVVRITEEGPEVIHIPDKTAHFRCVEKRLMNQLKRETDAVIKGSDCPGDQRIADILGGRVKSPTTTSRSLVFFSVRTDGESLTYRALGQPMPFPVPDEIRRRLPERFRSLVPEE